MCFFRSLTVRSDALALFIKSSLQGNCFLENYNLEKLLHRGSAHRLIPAAVIETEPVSERRANPLLSIAFCDRALSLRGFLIWAHTSVLTRRRL
jgi:hypothetical protein